MRCLDPRRHAPVLAYLAEQFAVCDMWFSSVPGETWPNRNFAHAATSDGASDIELGFYGVSQLPTSKNRAGREIVEAQVLAAAVLVVQHDESAVVTRAAGRLG
jgi:phospholipase C